MVWQWLVGVLGAMAAGTFLLALVLGIRSALGHDDRVMRVLFARLKGERRGPQWLERVPFLAWVPVILAIHVFVLLPLFAGAWAVRAWGRADIDR